MPPLVGFASWLLLNAALGEAEAWDAGGPYYAASLAIALLLGTWLREQPPPMAQGALEAAGQLVALFATAQEHTFVVLGVGMFVVLGLVFGGVASVGASIGRRLWR